LLGSIANAIGAVGGGGDAVESSSRHVCDPLRRVPVAREQTCSLK
jgi:hypothetical protein